MNTEKRIAALEIAVQELLNGTNTRSLKYIDGVLCERKPYAREWTPVEISGEAEKTELHLPSA